MEHHSLCPESSVHLFALPGLLPEQHYLLLDMSSRITLLFQIEGGKPFPCVRSNQLSPSAARAFLPLLESYPLVCSHEALFAVLFPPASERGGAIWDPTVGRRPLRRALAALLPALRTFGLDAVSLRGRGYLLISAKSERLLEGVSIVRGERDIPVDRQRTERLFVPFEHNGTRGTHDAFLQEKSARKERMI